MSFYTIGFVGFLILILSVIPGVYLWLPSRRDSAARSDLGVALMTGALIAFSVLAIQVLIERNFRQRDEARQRADTRQSLQLSLGLTKDLTAIKLADADLRGFYLYNKILQNAELSGADLTEATLTQSDLTGAKLRSAKLSGAFMNDVVLRYARMDGANLHDAILSNAKMSGANLTDATLVRTDFSTADLTTAFFEGAHMEGANFAGATLAGAIMTDAIVDDQTTFAEAKYDKNTKFPAGGVAQNPCRKGICIAH